MGELLQGTARPALQQQRPAQLRARISEVAVPHDRSRAWFERPGQNHGRLVEPARQDKRVGPRLPHPAGGLGQFLAQASRCWLKLVAQRQHLLRPASEHHARPTGGRNRSRTRTSMPGAISGPPMASASANSPAKARSWARSARASSRRTGSSTDASASSRTRRAAAKPPGPWNITRARSRASS